MKKQLKNPIFAFIIFGVTAYLLFDKLVPQNEETIVITPQNVAILITNEQNLYQRDLTEERKQEIIKGYIDEEVMLREAFKRDLHATDFRVRKRLLTLMHTSLTEVIPEPSIVQLRAYFDENRISLAFLNIPCWEIVGK